MMHVKHIHDEWIIHPFIISSLHGDGSWVQMLYLFVFEGNTNGKWSKGQIQTPNPNSMQKAQNVNQNQ